MKADTLDCVPASQLYACMQKYMFVCKLHTNMQTTCCSQTLFYSLLLLSTPHPSEALCFRGQASGNAAGSYKKIDYEQKMAITIAGLNLRVTTVIFQQRGLHSLLSSSILPFLHVFGAWRLVNIQPSAAVNVFMRLPFA